MQTTPSPPSASPTPPEPRGVRGSLNGFGRLGFALPLLVYCLVTVANAGRLGWLVLGVMFVALSPVIYLRHRRRLAAANPQRGPLAWLDRNIEPIVAVPASAACVISLAKLGVSPWIAVAALVAVATILTLLVTLRRPRAPGAARR